MMTGAMNFWAFEQSRSYEGTYVLLPCRWTVLKQRPQAYGENMKETCNITYRANPGGVWGRAPPF